MDIFIVKYKNKMSSDDKCDPKSNFNDCITQANLTVRAQKNGAVGKEVSMSICCITYRFRFRRRDL